MKVIYQLLILTVLIAVKPLPVRSQCTVRKDEQGIKVMSCEVKDSRLKSIKTVFELDADLFQLVSVLRDVSTYSSWQYRMINTKKIQEGDSSIMYYGEISAPWPVSNRDLIVRLEFDYNREQKTLVVNATGYPTNLPIVEHIIRVPEFKAKWIVSEISDHRLHVEYQLAVDIGGAIPVWIMNMAQAEGPFETFSNLRVHIQSEKYKRSKLNNATNQD